MSGDPGSQRNNENNPLKAEDIFKINRTKVSALKTEDADNPIKSVTRRFTEIETVGSRPLAPIFIKQEMKERPSVNEPSSSCEQMGTKRSRTAFTNAVAAAAARIVERTAESRTSVLKGHTWTIQVPQGTSQSIATEVLNSNNNTNILNSRVIDSKAAYINEMMRKGAPPKNTKRIISDPASQISLFDDEEGDEVSDWFIEENPQFNQNSSNKFSKRIKRRQNSEIQDEFVNIADGPVRPGWSYSCLIALALKNSPYGYLTVSEIYAFIMYYFPFFRKAPEGWRNSVRHNLSLNRCFSKVELDPNDLAAHKRCSYWMITPERTEKINADIRKWRERNPDPKDPCHGLAFPGDIESLEAGTKGMPPMDDRMRPLYDQQPNNQNLCSGELPEALAEFFVRVECPTDHYSTPLQPMGDQFPCTEMIFEASPLMDQLISSEQTMDTDNIRCQSFFISPFKDETNRQHARSVSPNSDFDVSHQGSTYNHCLGSFDSANYAVNDNSLLFYSNPNTTEKNPTTFPDCL